jgi:glycerate kinase
MLFQQVFLSIATLSSIAAAVDLTGYEYVIVGSGAGGGVSIILLVLIEAQVVTGLYL